MHQICISVHIHFKNFCGVGGGGGGMPVDHPRILLGNIVMLSQEKLISLLSNFMQILVINKLNYGQCEKEMLK